VHTSATCLMRPSSMSIALCRASMTFSLNLFLEAEALVPIPRLGDDGCRTGRASVLAVVIETGAVSGSCCTKYN
jgi:predicted component of type VI protein secretion system